MTTLMNPEFPVVVLPVVPVQEPVFWLEAPPTNVMVPDEPPKAAPDTRESAPESPAVAVPDDRTRMPDDPPLMAFAVVSTTDPVVAAALDPPRISRYPPTVDAA